MNMGGRIRLYFLVPASSCEALQLQGHAIDNNLSIEAHRYVTTE